jgi:hypothetical protein
VSTLSTADVVDGLLHARRGLLDDGERLVRRGLELAETTDFWELRGSAWMALADVLRERDRNGEARAAVEQAIEIFRAKDALVAEQRAHAALAEL